MTEVFVYSLGLGLGLLVGTMTIASRCIHNVVMHATDIALHPSGTQAGFTQCLHTVSAHGLHYDT